MKHKFSEVLTIINGRNQKTVENPHGAYPIYGSGGIMGYADDFLCPGNTVIIGRKGNINKPIYVDKPFWNVDTAFGLQAKETKLLPKYLFYFCQRYNFEKHNKTVTIPSLTKSDLLEIVIDVPEIDRQTRICAELDVIESLICNRQKSLLQLDKLVKSRFVEMFGEPVTNPMGWESKSLLEMGDCKNGMNFHKGESGVELHCLGVGDFQNLSVIADTTELPTVSLNEMPSKDYLLQNEDIVFVRSNGNKNLVGRCVAVYPNDVLTVFSGFCIRFRLTDRDYLTTDYLLHVLKHESMRQKMTGRGANIQNLNQQILSALEIPLPPIALQNQFADFVALTDKSKFAVQQSIDTLQTLKAKLMQDYFG